MAKWLTSLAFVLLTGGLVLADSMASGSASWRGKTIHFKITGADSARGSASSDRKQCTVRIEIDGKKRELLITPTGLVYQGKQIPLKDFKKVEVIGNPDRVRIVVDGKQVHPLSK